MMWERNSIGLEVHIDKVECVQDDGISVLRGAGLLLPEAWAPGTLAFIDPYAMDAATDAGITPLDLAKKRRVPKEIIERMEKMSRR